MSQTPCVDFDDQNVDVGGVDDRRGRGGMSGLPRGAAIGGGGGIVGLIVVLLVVLLGGGSGGSILDGLGATQVTGGQEGNGESREELRARCNADGALDEYVDCRLIKVYNVVNDTWTDELAARGDSYRPPSLTFFSGGTQTACGAATSQVGPFYCPGDQRIYLDLDFLQQLQQQLGAQGEFAQAYILAHEAGHHLQTLLGIEPQVRQAQQRNPGQANALSVRMELQADCFAGAWAKLADQRNGDGIALTQDDVAEAMRAAGAVGDDRIQESAGRDVDPETWTHGSAEQRQRWFSAGYESADLAACDPFNAA